MTILERLEARDTLLTVEELGTILGQSSKTLYKTIKAGRLPAYRINGIRVDPHDAIEWLRKRKTA